MRFSLFGFFRFLLLDTLLILMLACTAWAGEETHVVILGTSDVHGNIWGYSYEDNVETANNGMARLYTYIEQVREENPSVFLVDAGDSIQGTVMTDELANREPDNEHPVMAAMNYMGYDVMAIGNHEFNWGIDTMKKILSQAEFPILGANVLNQDGSYVIGQGWVIIERGGVKLAVIGVCTPDVPIWDGDKEGVADTIFEPADAAVKKALKEIGGRADIILVSAHMGQYPEYDEEFGSDSGQKIVEENPEVDILQTGHYHITVNDKIGEVPIVAVRNAGREIARIDVLLDQDRNITDISTEIVDMADYEPSEEIREIPVVKEMHERTIHFIQGINEDGDPGEPIGRTTAKFQPENEIKGLPEGRIRDTAVIDLILKVELLNSGADVASCALFKDRCDLPEGDIYYRNILDLYKFDNTLYTLKVTGRELKRYMEWSAEFFNQWMPGDINISYDPDYPTFRYDIFAGVDYEINLSKPKGERIENVMFKGEPLEDDQVLTLTVNNYRYISALVSENLVESKPFWQSSKSVRDMIADYFSNYSPVAPFVDNHWRITGVDLSEEDPRRAEIIGLINEGLLPTPYNESYNLAEYDELIALAETNRSADITEEEPQTH